MRFRAPGRLTKIKEPRHVPRSRNRAGSHAQAVAREANGVQLDTFSVPMLLADPL